MKNIDEFSLPSGNEMKQTSLYIFKSLYGAENTGIAGTTTSSLLIKSPNSHTRRWLKRRAPCNVKTPVGFL